MFGADRLLYIGVGDGGPAKDPDNHAQDLGLLCRSAVTRISRIFRASRSSGSGRCPETGGRFLASRPQVQERLGEQIADVIASSLDTRGVLVVLDASHKCVTMRSGRQSDASTVTIAARANSRSRSRAPS